MFLTLANIFNLLDGTHLIVLCIFGLLLFGKDLPIIARKVAKEYFRYKRMINDATSDIRREMDNAADQIEEEKRKIISDLDKENEASNGAASSNGSSDYNPGGSSNGENSESNGSENGSPDYPYGDTPPDAPQSRLVQTPAKPIADPLALDVPVPSATTQRATEAVKTPVASVAQLDTFQKSVPPPSRIPPPL